MNTDCKILNLTDSVDPIRQCSGRICKVDIYLMLLEVKWSVWLRSDFKPLLKETSS